MKEEPPPPKAKVGWEDLLKGEEVAVQGGETGVPILEVVR